MMVRWMTHGNSLHFYGFLALSAGIWLIAGPVHAQLTGAPVLHQNPVASSPGTPVPLVEAPKAPVMPPVRHYAAYKHNLAMADCMKEILPGNDASPVDIMKTKVAFTTDTSKQLQDCMRRKNLSYSYDSKAVGTVAQQPLPELNSYQTDRETRSERAKQQIAKSHLEGLLPAEGSKPVLPVVASSSISAQRPVQSAAAGLGGTTSVLASPTGSSVKATGEATANTLFVPSGASGPSPIFLH